MGGHPAVDGDHLPGDIARFAGSQKDDEIGDVLGLSDIWRERGPSEPSQHPFGQMRPDGVGDDEAGDDGVDPDPLFAMGVATYIVRVLTPALETP